jgi:hypothetical protein
LLGVRLVGARLLGVRLLRMGLLGVRGVVGRVMGCAAAGTELTRGAQ